MRDPEFDATVGVEPSLREVWSEGDRELVATVDRQMDDAYRRGGEHLVCAPGCTECCIGPFGIHRLDVLRLRAGLEELRRRDPDRARAILERAREATESLVPGFPGDPLTGILDAESEEEEDAYLDRFADLPCPVLDPATGTCDLYAHRPLTCRIYGPEAATSSGGVLEACRLCFTEASAETVAACRAVPDPEGLEDRLLERLEDLEGERGVTLIPLALARPGRV